jgi:hypothetical protein
MGIKIKNGTDTLITYSSDTDQTNGSGLLEPGQETGEMPNLNDEISYYESESNGDPVPHGFFASFTPGEKSNFSVFTVTGGLTSSKA